MPEVLRFGIHSLDELLGIGEKSGGEAPFGIYLPSRTKGKESSAKEKPFTTSICIVGPNGTGKSIFGLHMASRYLADCIASAYLAPSEAKKQLPAVLYVSTDFTFNMANRVWGKFGLDHPFSRKDPFGPIETQPSQRPEPIISLAPSDPTSLAEDFNLIEENRGDVIFVDIASYTAGDDWGFLHKLLSLLPPPGDDDAPRHLVVIDAIEGFELAGELNAFGESSTRRTRVAQTMRLTTGKSHVLLVVEEGKSYERLAEEFVADTVIRLENFSTRNYERRVLKVEKVRGQSHTRGQHPYSIRSGNGSTTGTQVNPDDPRVAAPSSTKSGDKRQSYVQVFHSVHRLNRKIMEAEREARTSLESKSHYAAFGIKYLDNMLGGKAETTTREKGKGEHRNYYSDTRGLPCRSTTALIGDSLTQKSALGKAFLRRCFYSFNTELDDLRKRLRVATGNRQVEQIWALVQRRIELLTDLDGPADANWETEGKALVAKGSWVELLRHIDHKVDSSESPLPASVTTKKLAAFLLGDEKPDIGQLNHDLNEAGLTHLLGWLLGYPGGVAVMLVTHNTHNEQLTEEFVRCLYSESDLKELNNNMPGYKRALENYIGHGTICRRLEIHNLSSEILIHIVQHAIKAAQRKLLTREEMRSDEKRNRKSWPIRVVIDDFSALRDIFPELREDPLLLPSILLHFEREGVTTLIVDTQSGKLDTTIAERFESELRKLVQHNLYTWRVPFYGGSRIAITAIPPFSSGYAGIVRELRWETDSLSQQNAASTNEPARVDPHFELYAGLEEGKPQSVPLRVHFYAETPALEAYIDRENKLLGELFVPSTHGSQASPPSVIVGVTAANYNELRDFAYLQRDTRLDHTLVFQVDEFWAMRPPRSRKRAGAFQPQWRYLNAITAKGNESDLDADPYELFQLRQSDISKGSRREAKPDPVTRFHFYKKYYEDFSDSHLIESYKDSSDSESIEGKGIDEPLIDRVPFVWDFGFLLCQERAWATGRAFKVRERDDKGDLREFIRTVPQVWDSLTKALVDPTTEVQAARREGTGENTKKGPKRLDYVSWRVFVEACKKTAEAQSDRLSKPVTAFDFAQISPESFSCLILEMWFSEILDTLHRKMEKARSDKDQEQEGKLKAEIKNFLDTVSKRRFSIAAASGEKRKYSLMLSTLLKDYWLELYKSWLLLIEVLNFSDIVGEATALNFDFRSKNTDFSAIASRHWYKTASQCPDEIAAKDSLVAVRLPGHFSVRGDWFLAVSGSSRSIRQAERALDLLNSRRANVTRLQLGIGLPTRFPKEEAIDLRTKLISHEQGHDNVDYGTFLKIGANSGGYEKDGFYWLWRSSLSDYVNCNRIWHKWLNRMLLSWHRNLLRYRSVWRNSFEVYDELTNFPPKIEEFAPTDAKRESIGRQPSEEEHHKELDDHPGKNAGKVTSRAQLKVRRDFRKLWEVLLRELEQASEPNPDL